MSSKITAEHRGRRAIVYVRQSTHQQVVENLESQRRQYALADTARADGFRDVEVLDEDLGKSGSGSTERPGFQRLVAAVCAGVVGAVYSIEASRLARNGRDWHHLIDLCGLVGTIIVDADGVYDPRILNDRLLLGLKGAMSEFELSLIRQRSLEAIRAKARRGELRYFLPAGFCWTQGDTIEMDPDRRVQDVISIVFRKFAELGSARQVLLWFRGEKVEMPVAHSGRFGREVRWQLPVYSSILSLLRSPLHAGAYVYGRRAVRTQVVDGRARKTQGHWKPRDQWMVLIPEHHPGYITWEQFERNQTVLRENTHMRKPGGRRSGRGGKCLLAGLLRCGRCGRMFHVTYTGGGHRVGRYFCRGANINHGGAPCLSVGSLRIDEAISSSLLSAVQPMAIDAAIQAAAQTKHETQDKCHAIQMELEQARYQIEISSRRFDAVDPSNRLVASELEARWNIALQRASVLEAKLRYLEQESSSEATLPDRDTLISLAHDLASTWNSPAADMRLKQRITRVLIQEIVLKIDDKRSVVVLTVHWVGGQHTELRVRKNRTGQHGRTTSKEALEIVEQMSGDYPDPIIAATLNRLGLKTGTGLNWKAGRVKSLRNRLHWPAYDPTRTEGVLTMQEAARQLGVSATVVRRLIKSKILPASQVIACAPWQIRAADLEDKHVKTAVSHAATRKNAPRSTDDPNQLSMIPTT